MNLRRLASGRSPKTFVLAAEGARNSFDWSSWLLSSTFVVIGTEAATAEGFDGCTLGWAESGPSIPSWRLGVRAIPPEPAWVG